MVKLRQRAKLLRRESGAGSIREECAGKKRYVEKKIETKTRRLKHLRSSSTNKVGMTIGHAVSTEITFDYLLSQWINWRIEV